MALRSNPARLLGIERLGSIPRTGRQRSSAGGSVRGGAARGSLEFTVLGARGLIQLGFGSGVIYAACMIHLRTQIMGSELGTVCAAAGAVLRGGAHRRAACRVFWGSGACAKGAGSARRAKAKRNKGCAGLGYTAEVPPWRSCGEGHRRVVFGHLGCAMGPRT